jgi:hypothetical protein
MWELPCTSPGSGVESATIDEGGALALAHSPYPPYPPDRP